MCGITGILYLKQNPEKQHIGQLIKKMTDSIHYRGPDDSGVFISNDVPLALGHRRLSILDLSETGKQPMSSHSRDSILVFNGEIYNFRLLKEKLEMQFNMEWRGSSDTEILLEALEKWGVEKTLPLLNGMFAFAFWNKKDRLLWLARDRFGEKPLYYAFMNGTLIFGSELKALYNHPDFVRDIDRNALKLYLRHNYIPAPHTIFINTRKLPPASFLRIPHRKINSINELKPATYWAIEKCAATGLQKPFNGSNEEAVELLKSHLKQAVSLRMESDVPLGAFLSGGIDSSLVAAVMQSVSDKPIRTFSVGFTHKEYDEAPFARQIAKHLRTNHTEIYVNPEEGLQVIDRLPEMFDEPFSDSSQIPTFLVCKKAREHVTVCLSGDAGDEFFCGYDRYFWTWNTQEKIKHIPRFLRHPAGKIMGSANGFLWEKALQMGSRIAPSQEKRMKCSFVRRCGHILSSPDAAFLYLQMLSHWPHPEKVVIGDKQCLPLFPDWQNETQIDLMNRMMLCDQQNYLPDDILTKVDRSSMAVSLESRIPFLDPDLAQFAWSLPLEMKTDRKKGKLILRQLLAQYIPPKLFERPKKGFGVPIDHWLRHELRDWAEALLSETRLKNEGFFQAGPVREKWQEHLSGKCDWHYYLWDILMFQAWLENINKS
jgi:asparagine synthase (glutamine-hydrolysing)